MRPQASTRPPRMRRSQGAGAARAAQASERREDRQDVVGVAGVARGRGTPADPAEERGDHRAVGGEDRARRKPDAAQAAVRPGDREGGESQKRDQAGHAEHDGADRHLVPARHPSSEQRNGWRPARSDTEPDATRPERSRIAARRSSSDAEPAPGARRAYHRQVKPRRGGAVKATAFGAGAPRSDIGADAPALEPAGSFTAASIFRGLKLVARLFALARSAGLNLFATSSRFLAASSSPWPRPRANQA